MKVIILAGGGGTRLFPLSRTSFPKQFLKIAGEQSLLCQTVERFLPLVKPKDIIVVTNRAYRHQVQAELASCDAQEAHVILEPEGRNTAPAIALAARYCLDQTGADSGEVLFVSTSDHIIRPTNQFIQAVEKAAALASAGKVVTFGIQPDKPETGYGYIQAGEAIDGGFVVRSFKEKPDKATAERYLAAGGYYWNSGMFAFTIDCILEEFKAYQPDIYRLVSLSYAELQERFTDMPNISLDYAVAEQSQRTVILPFTAYWNDIGSWDAIYDVLDKDVAGNAIEGDCLAIDCSNTLMLGHDRFLAGIGLEDLLVVETADVIVVAHKGESQKVSGAGGKRMSRQRRCGRGAVIRCWGKGKATK